ncbi:MAG: hypothetical protein ABIA37_00970 [Candidatus Woesearchaeota archaeon]
MAKKAAKKRVSKRKTAKKAVKRSSAVKRVSSKPKPQPSRWHAVPLKGSFMVTAILGILLSYYYVFPVSYNFGIACMIIFAVMFFAAIVSMTKAPIQVD